MSQIPTQQEQQQLVNSIQSFIERVNETLVSQGEAPVDVPKSPQSSTNMHLVAGGVLLAAGIGYMMLKK